MDIDDGETCVGDHAKCLSQKTQFEIFKKNKRKINQKPSFSTSLFRSAPADPIILWPSKAINVSSMRTSSFFGFLLFFSILLFLLKPHVLQYLVSIELRLSKYAKCRKCIHFYRYIGRMQLNRFFSSSFIFWFWRHDIFIFSNGMQPERIWLTGSQYLISCTLIIIGDTPFFFCCFDCLI